MPRAEGKAKSRARVRNTTRAPAPTYLDLVGRRVQKRTHVHHQRSNLGDKLKSVLDIHQGKRTQFSDSILRVFGLRHQLLEGMKLDLVTRVLRQRKVVHANACR